MLRLLLAVEPWKRVNRLVLSFRQSAGHPRSACEPRAGPPRLGAGNKSRSDAACLLSCPGVHFAGVNQLYPMSIWNIQNSPASLDPPATSPVNSPVQIHDEETALTGQDPGSPLSYLLNTVPTVPPVPHQALPGVQGQSTSLGQMGGAAQVLTPGRLPTPEPPPQPLPCLKSAQGPGTLAEPHIGTRDAASHGLLGKRRRLAEGGWRASPAGPAPSALPEAPARSSPVTLESLYRSLEDLRISVLRNLGAVHRQVEALEKRIHLLERWRAEMEGRQQLPEPQQP
ncbi:uncharacterized protein LOC103063237 [Python bivittatus]|uniref:Uncharacterized protein LOC103063237 n=1 Tax=Python bivittatus TaxID=176946 RepID=A0A9F2WLX5_PYTBI|nr:uncharacterized protein LOC103063237 [Python bivittatus]